MMFNSQRYKLMKFLKMLPLEIRLFKRLIVSLAYIICIIICCQYFIETILTLTTTAATFLSHYNNSTIALNNSNKESTISKEEEERKKLIRVQRSISFLNTFNQNDSTRRSNSTKIWTSHKDRIAQNATIFYPWVGDVECELYFVQFAPNKTFTPRALVSYPGSGNSWLRYLIDVSSGIFTGSVFQDKALYNYGLLGEFNKPNSGQTLVQKTHHDTIYHGNRRRMQAYVKLSELLFGYRGILLIRNPYHALLSYWNYRKTLSHKGFTSGSHANNKDWDRFVRVGIKQWSSLIKSWLKNSLDFHVTLYEDLKSHPKEELIKILNYLGRTINPERMNCVLKHIEGPFHRRDYLKTHINHKNEHKVESKISQSRNTTSHYHSDSKLTLDLIVQQNINEINLFLEENSFPLFLNYTGTML